MKNGPYEFVIAPDGYPGKKYRGRYAYRHRVVFWEENGYLPEVIHHKNKNKVDNSPENLEGQTRVEHAKQHAKYKDKERDVVHATCFNCKKLFVGNRNILYNFNKGQERFFCSRSCQVSTQQIELRIKRTGGEVQHGTKNTYAYWGCRCPKCKEANRLAAQEYRKKHK